ncbi:MAG: hypothetical protein SXQ77_04590, partial [Halobacteria archaeon]|nr:hypothetical protein [Halobacteria archaeon]
IRYKDSMGEEFEEEIFDRLLPIKGQTSLEVALNKSYEWDYNQNSKFIKIAYGNIINELEEDTGY